MLPRQSKIKDNDKVLMAARQEASAALKKLTNSAWQYLLVIFGYHRCSGSANVFQCVINGQEGPGGHTSMGGKHELSTSSSGA